MTYKLQLNELEDFLSKALSSAIEGKCRLGDLEEVDFSKLLESDMDLPELNIDRGCRQGCFGYPTTPLYKNLAAVLHEWSSTGQCPVRKLPVFEAFDDKNYMGQFEITEREVYDSIRGMESLWELWNIQERIYRVQQILRLLGRRGILTLLGVRKTAGSVDLWPPNLSLLVRAFDTPVCDATTLSEGARAISKHFHRDNTSRFWGVCTGNDAQKTRDARKKLEELIAVAVWINIHELPGKMPVIEIRQENGYGARWLADGSAFRGLLEPHMVDGHAVGWKH